MLIEADRLRQQLKKRTRALRELSPGASAPVSKDARDLRVWTLADLKGGAWFLSGHSDAERCNNKHRSAACLAFANLCA